MLKFKTENGYFYRILISFFLVITFTISVVSSILYINFESIAKELIFKTTKSKLYQSSYSIKFQSEYVEGLALKIVADNQIKKLLSSSSLNAIDTNAALNVLNNYRYSSPMIHSIYVINKYDSTIYISASGIQNMISSPGSFYDKDILKYFSDLKNYKKLSPIPRSISILSGNGNTETSKVYSYMYYDSYTNYKNIENIIIINVSASWMFNTLKLMDDDKTVEKNTLIVDQNANTVFSSAPTDSEHEGYVSRIISSKEDAGYFVTSIKNVDYLITYVKPGYYNWSFISITPYSSVIGSVEKLRIVTLIIGLAILIFGLLISLILSQKLYKPIGVIFTKLSKLEDEKSANLVEVKNKFLTALLKGNVHENTQKLFEELYPSKDIVLNKEYSLYLILLKIDHYADFCSNFEYNERKNKKSQAFSIAKNVLTPLNIFEFVEMDNDSSVLVCSHEAEDIKEFKEKFNTQLKTYQTQLKDITDVSYTISISPPGHTYRDLSFIYSMALTYSRYRFIFGHMSIIYSLDIPDSSSEISHYLFQKEKALTEAIMLEKCDAAIEIYKQSIEQLGIVPVEIYSHTLNQVFFVIRAAFHSKVNDTSIFLNNFTMFFEELRNVETFNEANIIFVNLLNKIFLYLQETKKTKYEDLVQNVISYIEDNYYLNSLSVNSIADTINMSAAYLGKLFKQITSESLPDYISKVRLTKSNELLKNSNIIINEIAEKVGFTNSSYFYAVYKKEFGITPSQYRQQNQV